MPQIETARLLLRPFVWDDRDTYHTIIRSDPDVMRYLPGGEPQPREETDRVIRFFMDAWNLHGFGGFAVIHKDDQQLIGQCGLAYIPNTDKVELFYALGKAYWGQGYAPEAARAVLRYGFEAHNLTRIYAVFVPGNTGSERVMIKLGMQSQGLIPAYNTELPCYVITPETFDYADGVYHYTA